MRHRVRDLSVEEITQIAESFKGDMQREVNRMVRRHDTQSALAALEAIEYIEKFVVTLKMRAGSQLHTLVRPPRARAINIPKVLRSK